MNWQEIFDTCSAHLIAQNEKSMNKHNGMCKYRIENKDGKMLKCAVGVFITDEQYNPVMESGVTTLIEKINYNIPPFDKLDSTIFNDDNEEILRAIQRVHDNNEVEGWKPELIRVAQRYKLEVKFE